MNNTFRFALTGTVAVIFFSVSVLADPKPPQMSPLEIQQIETHEYDAGIENVYPAIVSVLQDTGYTISTSDRAGGIITAVASAKSKLSYNIWWGMGKKKRTQTASFFMEPRPGGRTRVRLNIVNGLVKSNLIYGGARSDTDTPLLDAAVYQGIFEKISQAVFVRLAADAPNVPGPQAKSPGVGAVSAQASSQPLVSSGTPYRPAVVQSDPVPTPPPSSSHLVACADGTSMYVSGPSSVPTSAKCKR